MSTLQRPLSHAHYCPPSHCLWHWRALGRLPASTRLTPSLILQSACGLGWSLQHILGLNHTKNTPSFAVSSCWVHLLLKIGACLWSHYSVTAVVYLLISWWQCHAVSMCFVCLSFNRYDFERLSNKLARVKRLLNWREPIPEGYFSKLDSLVASRVWPPRHSNAVMRVSDV
jgi:hypothetical protein